MTRGTWLRRLQLSLALLATLVVVGCAHPLTLTPNLTGLSEAGAQKIDKKVGLLVTEEDRRVEVTTPGGGGDQLRYFPYRDLEVGLYAALSEVFTGVSRVASPTDPKVQSEGLRYVVTPRLRTTSFSDSVLTWPPTLFTIELSCKVTDAAGATFAWWATAVPPSMSSRASRRWRPTGPPKTP